MTKKRTRTRKPLDLATAAGKLAADVREYLENKFLTPDYDVFWRGVEAVEAALLAQGQAPPGVTVPQRARESIMGVAAEMDNYAGSMHLGNGGPDATNLEAWSRELAEALRDLNLAAALGAGKGDSGPAIQQVSRREDMSTTGTLTLHLQQDGDVVVVIRGEDWVNQAPTEASVEFCTPSAGGGRSPRTLTALRRLMEAMAADNAERPDLGTTERWGERP